ncbi:MAG: hypothetical protein JWQ38_3799 [Flavipsychrobacter sp.]|nr:hypothetical protein [Flavipsychrobacter sp.]
MGIVFRQSAKNSIIVAVGALLGALIIWLSTTYIPNKRELGFTQGLVLWSLTISQILILGLNNTLSVYIHKYATDERKRKLLITISLFFPLLLSVLFTIVYSLFRVQIVNHFQLEDRPLMQQYFYWFPVFAVIWIYMIMLEIYLGSQLKVAAASFMREILLRVLNIVLLFLFGFNYIGFSGLVGGLVLIYLAPVCVFFLLALKTEGFGFSFRLRSFTISEYKELLHFSWYHFLLSISLTLIGLMDILLLPFYDHNGYASVAIYRVAQFLIALMQLPSKAFLPASFAVFAKAFTNNEMDKAKDLFVRSSINVLIPTVGIGVLLCCNLNNALAIIPNGYAEVIPVFYILFIQAMVNLATGMNDQVLTIANYYKFNFYLSLVLIGVQYVLIRFLVPQYGVYGAAFSTTITVVIFNIMKFFFVWKKLDMQPFSMKTVLILLAGIPAFAAGYFFPYLFEPARHIYVHTFIDAAMRSTVIVVVYVIMLLWLKPSPDLSEYLSSIKKNKRLF